MVKVSVVVPIYNVEKYLRRCLDSLVSQTIDSYELILVNDGSTDSSQVIVDEYVAKYPKLIKSYYKPNGGLSSARNYGIEYATGEYIGFVDSDDWVDENMFYEMYANAKQYDSDLVCCGYQEIFPDKINYHLPFYTGYNLCRYKMQVVSWNKIYRTKFVQENSLSFMIGVLHEDFDFTTRVLSLTSKVTFMEDYFYFYNRLNQNSITGYGGMNAASCSKIIENLFLWKKNKKILDDELDEYLLCWIYDYLLVYEKDVKHRNKFIRDNFINIIKISESPIKIFIKLLIILVK